MVNIWHFSGKFDQHLSLYCGSVKAKFKTGPGYWFLLVTISKLLWQFWHSFLKYLFKTTVSFLPHWNIVEKNGELCLFETGVKETMTFAYIMTFQYIYQRLIADVDVTKRCQRLHEISYRLISGFSLSRVNLDKSMRFWCVKCKIPKVECTGQASKSKRKCIILSNFRAESKYQLLV